MATVTDKIAELAAGWIELTIDNDSFSPEDKELVHGAVAEDFTAGANAFALLMLSHIDSSQDAYDFMRKIAADCEAMHNSFQPTIDRYNDHQDGKDESK